MRGALACPDRVPDQDQEDLGFALWHRVSNVSSYGIAGVKPAVTFIYYFEGRNDPFVANSYHSFVIFFNISEENQNFFDSLIIFLHPIMERANEKGLAESANPL